MASRIAALFLLSGAALALKGPTNYADEAANVMKMMEAVRVETGGKPKAAPVVQKAAASAKDGEMFPGLDDELMNKADNIEKELQNLDTAKEGTKKLTLAAKKDDKETSKDRAARFFATHGMMDMGKLLGDQMSSDETKKVQEEAANERSKP